MDTPEEREYVEADVTCEEEQQNISYLRELLHDAQEKVKRCKAECKQRDTLLHMEQVMFSRVFAAPTPDAPLDDQLEAALRSAEDENAHRQGVRVMECRTLSLLMQAKCALDSCVRPMEFCGRTLVVYCGGESEQRRFQRSAFAAAQPGAAQFSTLLMQAKTLNAGVGSIPALRIPYFNASMSDVAPVDIHFPDLAHDDKIRAGVASVQTTHNALLAELTRTHERAQHATRAANIAAVAEARARAVLTTYRRATFLSFMQPPRRLCDVVVVP